MTTTDASDRSSSPWFTRGPLSKEEADLLEYADLWVVSSDKAAMRKALLVALVRKFPRCNKWSWRFASLSSPTLFTTKREALESLKSFVELLRDAAAGEAHRRSLNPADLA